MSTQERELDAVAVAARTGKLTGFYGAREFKNGEEVIVSDPIAHDERVMVNEKSPDVVPADPDSDEVLERVAAGNLSGTFKGTVYKDGRRIGWHDRPEMPSPVLRMPER
jgi:hypothetical protein